MLSEEIEHIEHIFKSVSILEGDEVCSEEDAEIVQSFQDNIAKDLQDAFQEYKTRYEFESSQFDVNESELLQDYIAENALDLGLGRLKSYADLYYILKDYQIMTLINLMLLRN